MAERRLYFPFDDISKDPTMPGNRKRYEDKYAADLTVVMKGESLSGVGDNDMLIIAGHGLPNSSKTGVTTEPANAVAAFFGGHGTQTCRTASDLAALLAGADLPLGHRYIKLITCSGAGMVSVDDANATFNADRIKVIGVTAATQTHEAECIASVLAAALGS